MTPCISVAIKTSIEEKNKKLDKYKKKPLCNKIKFTLGIRCPKFIVFAKFLPTE